MLKLNKKDFINALKFALVCAPKRDVRVYINSVMLEVRNDSLKVVSTDGHRLSVVTLEVEHVPFELIGREIIIERESIEQVTKMFKVARDGAAVELTDEIELHADLIEITEEDKKLVMKPTNYAVKVVADGVEMNLEVIKGKYPSYNQLIAGKSFGEGSVEAIGLDANYLADAGKMFKIVKEGKFNQLKLEFISSFELVRITSGGGVRSCGQLKDATIYLMPCKI